MTADSDSGVAPSAAGEAASARGEDLDRVDMTRLTAGGEAALNSLMQRHGQALFHYLIRQLQSEAEAEDLAQETFVRVYQHRAKYDPRQKFSTWLYAIATNLARDRFRWRTRHPQVSLEAGEDGGGGGLEATLPQAGANPREVLEQEERVGAIRRALAALPEELRTPLILAEYEQRPQEEIAAILGCSRKAVETRIYRARKQLAAVLRKAPLD